VPRISAGRRPAPDAWDIAFGAAALAVSVAALLWWFPSDIRGGFIEVGAGGRREPGDAFFPVLLAATMLVLGVVHVTAALLGKATKPGERAVDAGRLTWQNLRFLAVFHAVVLGGLAVVYWLGPLVVHVLGALGVLDASYRHLVDTVPYKYLGYVAGGFGMTVALAVWAEGGLTRRAIVAVAIVITACVLIFDVFLTNVPLPPNADY
jgi:hypothetical protein